MTPGRKAIDLTGQRFGRLVVLERRGSYRSNTSSVPLWLCRCDCGSEVLKRTDALRLGNTVSCGCLHDELASKRSKKMQSYIGKKKRDRGVKI